ncbi:MAG TPA: 3-hydroxyacyl-CoA dehydrogenase NAD-binding domain-containing protein [Novosphingobium sp.]|nr:3-hydroxyacyl-CoA dehydrogenase NAD-binding domain-containing protein [Novosphingobium sp.]
MLVDRVAIVGCGLVGIGWTATFLTHGLKVTCIDPAPGAEDRLWDGVKADFRLLRLGDERAAEAIESLRFEPDLAKAVADADWVQENGPETVAAKRALIAEISRAAPDHTIIASSSSSITVSAMQTEARRPDRVVLGHPFIPVPLMALVEVAGGDLTEPAAIERAMAFYRSIGKIPIRLKREVPGHVGNRLQAALMREAFHLLQEGVASVEDIDLAVTEGPGARWAVSGPFITHHLAGGEGGARRAFEHLGPALQAMWSHLGSPSLTPELQRKTIEGIEQTLAARGGRDPGEERMHVLHAIREAKNTFRERSVDHD